MPLSLRVLMLAAPAVAALAEGPQISMEEMLKLHAEMEEATESAATPTMTEAEWDVELARRLNAYSASYSYVYVPPPPSSDPVVPPSGDDAVDNVDNAVAEMLMQFSFSYYSYADIHPKMQQLQDDELEADDVTTHAPTKAPTRMPTAQPTASPVPKPTAPHGYVVCADSTTWSKSGKDCNWVSKDPTERCSKTGDDGTYAYESCEKACSTGSCESTAVECADDVDWYKAGQPFKSCVWVSKDKEKRCDDNGEDGTLADVGCPVTCGTCEDVTCADSDTWFKNGDTNKGCTWVSKETISRCSMKNQFGELSSVGCPYTCGYC